MVAKKIIGLVASIIGIALILLSIYITNRTEEGKMQVASAQKKVDQGTGLFSLNPVAKEIGKEVITDPAQKKIHEGNQQIAQYEMLAKWSQIGGIALFVLGAGIVFIGRKK